MKLGYSSKALHVILSHPTRGAWIEIGGTTTQPAKKDVAPHTGCVD